MGTDRMDDHLRATDNAIDQNEEEKLLVFTVSDAELEKAAGGTVDSRAVGTLFPDHLRWPRWVGNGTR